MSLRERKKRRTRATIVEAATELFSGVGFGATTMEQVAERAEVGVGTLYNYFASKDLLLLAVAEQGTATAVERGDAVVAAAGTEGLHAVVDLLDTYLDEPFLRDKPLMREIFGVAFSPACRELAEGLIELDMRLVGQLVKLIGHLQRHGAAATEHRAEDVAMVLYSTLGAQLMMYFNTPDMDEAALRSSVERQVNVVFSGVAPRASSSTAMPQNRRTRRGAARTK